MIGSEVALTVAAAIGEARRQGVARLDAELLLARILAVPRSALIAHDDRPLAPAAGSRWSEQLARRAAGEPLAYLLGEKEFFSLLLRVTSAVLVPRPETELLVEWALEILDQGSNAWPTPAVADLGTGSGAIALAIKQFCPLSQVLASDVSPAALAVAGDNADHLGLDVAFVESSWWQRLDGWRFDLVVSNPPYIDAGDPHLAALRHEPQAALTPGDDGLAALAEIVAGAPAHLGEGGWLILEHGFDQGEAVQSMLRSAGWRDVSTRADLGGLPRATGGRRSAR